MPPRLGLKILEFGLLECSGQNANTFSRQVSLGLLVKKYRNINSIFNILVSCWHKKSLAPIGLLLGFNFTPRGVDGSVTHLLSYVISSLLTTATSPYDNYLYNTQFYFSHEFLSRNQSKRSRH